MSHAAPRNFPVSSWLSSFSSCCGTGQVQEEGCAGAGADLQSRIRHCPALSYFFQGPYHQQCHAVQCHASPVPCACQLTTAPAAVGIRALASLPALPACSGCGCFLFNDPHPHQCRIAKEQAVDKSITVCVGISSWTFLPPPAAPSSGVRPHPTGVHPYLRMQGHIFLCHVFLSQHFCAWLQGAPTTPPVWTLPRRSGSRLPTSSPRRTTLPSSTWHTR